MASPLDVASTPGCGSTFKVYFPAALGLSAEEQPRLCPHSLLGKGETILIVDDEQPLREIARSALERHGYQALQACHGAEAVVACARQPGIALVLLDMAMPVMDGLAAIVALRQLNPTLPIIASSGVNSSDAAAKPIAAGADQFLAKPYTTEDLLRAIQDTLTRRQQSGGQAADESRAA